MNCHLPCVQTSSWFQASRWRCSGTRRRRRRLLISFSNRSHSIKDYWLESWRTSIRRDLRRRYWRGKNWRWMLRNWLLPRKRKIFITITKSLSIATVEELLLEKWWPVKTHIARGSGFIFLALRRRIYQRNGTVWIAKSRGIRPETLFREGISLIRKM